MIVVPVKKRMRVVPLESIAGYLRCDVDKLLTSIDHLFDRRDGAQGEADPAELPPHHRRAQVVRAVDKALWAFGKFLSDNNFPREAHR